jgi:PTH1 family peptidyl-tRNA hydrolase
VGWRVVAAVAKAAGAVFTGPIDNALWAGARLGGEPVLLLQPQGFMNASGPPVVAWVGALGLHPERLLVVADDLDLEVGRVKVASGGGDAGHRGLRSIAEALGTQGFLRLRVGIGRPAGEDAAAYVLSPPAPAEAEALRVAEAMAAEAVWAVVAEGPTAAMNRFNPWPAVAAPADQ